MDDINTSNSRSPTPDAATRLRQVKWVLWQILGVNLLVAVAKIAVGLAIGSVSMIADGFHSTLDGSSNVIGLIGLAIAARPPDKEHPYGHQKYETFATLGIGLLLLLAGWNVLQSAFDRIVTGGAPEVTVASFAVMALSITLSLGVTRYENLRGQQLKSSILLADAAHTRSDIFVSLSVVVSLITAALGWPWMDGVIAVVIVIVIGWTGWKIIRDASRVLADSAVIDPAAVEKIVLSVDGVKSSHKIRSRGTEQATYLDLHIQVDGRMSLEEAHRLGHLVQHRLKEELGVTDVVVHAEPLEFKRDDSLKE